MKVESQKMRSNIYTVQHVPEAMAAVAFLLSKGSEGLDNELYYLIHPLLGQE